MTVSSWADHLSHLYILVLCASCTNSMCLWGCVLHQCLWKGLAPLSGGRHWQASKMRHHCSLSAALCKIMGGSYRGTWHRTLMSRGNVQIVIAASCGSWCIFPQGRWRILEDDDLISQSAGPFIQFYADNMRKCINESNRCAQILEECVKQGKKDQTALRAHGPNKVQTISGVFLALNIGQQPAHT